MAWNAEKQKALDAFFKFYRDHPDGYTAESLGTYMAHVHVTLNTHSLEEKR